MNDSNLFLASKELNIDNINFDEINGETNKLDSLFPQQKIIFISEKEQIEEDIEIIFLKYSKNNIILKINLLSENIYKHMNDFPVLVRVFESEFFIKKLSLKNNGTCNLKLQKGKNV